MSLKLTQRMFPYPKLLHKKNVLTALMSLLICPGSVNTEIWDTPTIHSHSNFDLSQILTPEIVAATILHTVLLPEQAVIQELTIMSNAGVL